MTTTPRLPRALAALLLLVLPVACTTAPGPVAGTAVAKDPRLQAWVGAPSTLHPHLGDGDVTAALFDPLVVLAPGTRAPAWGDDASAAVLAAIRTDDLRRWELELKPDRVWHDGTPVTAADLQRGVAAARAAGLPGADVVADVQVVDKQRLRIALDAPYARLPELLAADAFLPLPAAAEADPDRFAAAPVGTGPYAVTAATDEAVVLAAVPGHPGGTAATPTITLSRADGPTAADDVVVGEDGGVLEAPAVGQQLIRVPGHQLAYLSLPLDEPRWADPTVRRALSQAIDREVLAGTVLEGAVVPADRLLGPGIGRPAGVRCTACAVDESAAASAWEDARGAAGRGDGVVRLWVAEGAAAQPVADFLAESWRRTLGIDDIEIGTAAPDALIERVAAGGLDGPARVGWAADVPVPTRVLQPLFGRGGAANDGPYESAAVDALLDRADLTPAAAEAMRLYARAEQLVLDDLPVIPLWFSTIPVVLDEDVVVEVDARARLDWRTLRRL